LPFGPAEARAAARIRADLERSGRGVGPLDTLIAATRSGEPRDPGHPRHPGVPPRGWSQPRGLVL